jgi:dTDP-L-rhamnose 4-epimerase
VEVVFHEAALVGVGQSMYDIERYTHVNSYGTAVLLQAIVGLKDRPRKMIVASSMSIYGEGAYTCPIHREVHPKLREKDQLADEDWELHCPVAGCKEYVFPAPTHEDKPLYPTSIYAINKRDQEEMFLSVGRAYNIPAVALRYFNTYGVRQALSNPYTGVAAIFSSRLLNGNPPVVYEDGKQIRDFVDVRDIARANLIVMNNEKADYQAFNVGTGRSISILDVANVLMTHFNELSKNGKARQIMNASAIEITGKYRVGDIRHCFPDIGRLQALGYEPKFQFEDGITNLANWIVAQTPVDSFDQARQELVRRGLSG